MEIIVYSLFVAAFYMLPYILAKILKKENAPAIGILNLFAGWTAIGWIGALVWAAMNNKKPIVVPVRRGSSRSDADTDQNGEPYVRQALRPSQRHVSDAYFDSMSQMQTAVSQRDLALLHGPEQIADLPVPVAESPGAVRIGHPERSHLVEYLAPNSVFNSLPRQRSSPHLRPDDRLVTIDRVLHHASLGVA